MPFTFLDAGNVQRVITRMQVQEAGLLRNIKRMKVMDDDDVTLRTVAIFATTMTLSATPESLYTESSTSNVQTSDPATATPSGGLAPYTYSWATIAGTATANSPTSATTTFTSGTLSPDVLDETTLRCTCTDSSGQTATDEVVAGFTYVSPF